MKKPHLKLLAPAVFAATLALALGVAAEAPPPDANGPQAAPATGHHEDGAAGAEHHPQMAMDCQAMMARKREMQDKLQVMDATLDRLVTEMNAAQGSKDKGALEQSLAAVLNELVAERKASRSMIMEMQHAMLTHMMQHMHMQGAKGAMECPMLRPGDAPERQAEETRHKT
jgi:hypothetical protein